MSKQTSFCFFVGLLMMFAAGAMKQKKFALLTSSTGAEVCATDIPTTTLWLLMDMMTQCGMQCLIVPTCMAYNFITHTGRCDLYQDRMPTNFTIVPGCKSFQIDKCSTDNGGCSSIASCHNVPGGVSCMTSCNIGYFWNGSICKAGTNLALNKMAWQISTLNGYYATLAVDGNLQTFMNTNSNGMQWWGADLGSMFNIQSVMMYSRPGYDYPGLLLMLVICAEFRLNNFVVGLTNKAPNEVSPLNGSYSTCGQWLGAALRVAMPVLCEKGSYPARYVIIILNNTRDTVNIAELKVFGTA